MRKLNAKELESVSGGHYAAWASQLRGMLSKGNKYNYDDATWSEITEYCHDILHSIAYAEDENGKLLKECCQDILSGNRRSIASADYRLRNVEDE